MHPCFGISGSNKYKISRSETKRIEIRVFYSYLTLFVYRNEQRINILVTYWSLAGKKANIKLFLLAFSIYFYLDSKLSTNRFYQKCAQDNFFVLFYSLLLSHLILVVTGPGLPNPNFTNQVFFVKNQELIRRFFLENQEKNQEISCKESKDNQEIFPLNSE